MCIANQLSSRLSSPCPENPNVSGYPDAASFVTAIKAGETTFLLCPGVLYDEQLPIDPNEESPVSISCADLSSSCTWEVKEGSHIVYDGSSAISLAVQGINFTGASSASIQVQANPGSVFEFVNCIWNANEGLGLFDMEKKSSRGLENYNTTEGISTYSAASDSTRQLQDDNPSGETRAQLLLSGCSFTRNSATASILLTKSADLVMKDCMFDVNNAQSGIVSLIGGSHHMRGVSFQDNVVEESGIIHMDDEALLSDKYICGAGNTVSKFCNGTFREIVDPESCVDGDNVDECDPACNALDECDVEECVSSLKELTVALRKGGNIYLCSDTVFDLSVADEPIKIVNVATSLKCTQNCVFTGGNKQFRVLDGAESVSFHNLTFTDSETVSIIVEIDLAEPASVSFFSCEWSGHSGRHVMLIDPPGQLEENDQLEAIVEITDSKFFDNAVDKYLISNGGVGLSVNACEFRGNSLSKSIVGALGGETYIGWSKVTGRNSTGKTVLQSNKVQAGLFHVGINSSSFEAGHVCGNNNTDRSTCNGTFYDALNPTECKTDNTNEEACKEGCILIDECDDEDSVDYECYSEWPKLVDSVASADTGQEFVVCPGSDFVLGENDTLYLASDEIVLRCGRDSKRSNFCTIAGGDVQIEIYGSASGIRVEGMTFVGSSNTSIAALGNKDSSATISNCEFSGHSGEAAIIVIAKDGIFNASSSVPESMRVIIDECVFEDNVVALAPVVNLQGDVEVSKTEFKGNTGRSGAGGVVSYTRLSLSASCFSSNSGNVSGSIILSANAAQSFSQTENFGENNEAMIGNCSDIFTLDESLTCDEFDSSECRLVSSVESSAPSGVAPTSSPAPSSVGGTGQLPTTIAPTPVGPCYTAEEWEDLSNAISSSPGEEMFTICDDTVIDMSDMEAQDWAPLIIKASGITFRCGSQRRNGCILSGGTTHIVIQGDVKNVRVRGVTMEQASNTSVIANVNAPFSIEFEACEWKNNSGENVVFIEATVNSTENNDPTGNSSTRRDLVAADDNVFVCDRCLFENNDVTGSILAASGTSMILDAVVFSGNGFDGSAIFVDNGLVDMKDSCVMNSKSKGDIVEAKSSEVVVESMFLSGNSISGCAGFIDIDGTCDDLASAKKCVAEEKRCFSHWLDLADSMSNSSKGRVFTICDGAILDVANSSAIEIRQSNTTIRCGLSGAREGNCFVTGGGVHFHILGTPTDVKFSGITFSGASIAAINAAGKRGSKAQIVDCLFEKMTSGQAALLVYFGKLPSSATLGRKTTIDDYTESSTRAMTVRITYSSFESNNVELAAIANLKGTVEVMDCDFSGNNGIAGAIGDWFGGSMSLSSSCFNDNTGEIAGSVLVDGNETTQKKNYGEGNSATDADCDSIFLSKASSPDNSSPGLCLEFSESKCKSKPAPTAAPTPSPTLPGEELSKAPTDCIGSWDDLASSVATLDAGIENIIILCPDTKFKVSDDPIILDQAEGDVWIECGSDGRIRDNCVITGGDVQFRITGKKSKVSFRGVTFEKSKIMSIVAAADAQSTARFDECQWTGHSGEGVVLIYNEESGQKFDGATPIPELVSTTESMTVEFTKGIFTDSPVTYATVSNIGGSLTLSLTAFRDHQNIVAAVIVTRSDAVLSLERCCFVENDSNLPGVILMSEQSQLEKNQDNFGYDNRISLSDCMDIWTVSLTEDCSPTSCPGECANFDSADCRIPSFDFELPSSSPSVIPIGANPFSTNSPAFAKLDVTQTTLLASGYFFQNLFVAALVALIWFGSFFYCKCRHEPKKEKVKIETSERDPLYESAPNEAFHDDSSMPKAYDDSAFMPQRASVILDPDALKKSVKSKKRGNFFRRPVQEQGVVERQPIVDDGHTSSMSFNNYGEYDRFDHDSSQSSFDEIS